jgi:hypothetical protein
MGELFKYGQKRLQVVFVDDDGYPIGIELDNTVPDPNAPVVGNTYHALVLTGYVTATPAIRETDVATNKADGKNYGDKTVGVNTYGNVEITLSMRHELFFEMIRRVTANTSVSSGMRISSKNNTSTREPLMGLIVTDLVRDEETGEEKYEHNVYNKGTFTVTGEAEGNQTAGVNPSPLTITFKPLPSERHVLTGIAYSALGLGVNENEDTDGYITSDYEFTITTFIKDGAEDEFITKYKPVVAGATIGGVNVFSSEGVQAALTSLSVTTGVGVMAAVGTSGHRAVTAYATAFIEV